MQALAKRTEVILFGFEGVENHSLSLKEKASRELQLKVSLHTFFFKRKYAPLAQLVEHLTLNQGVQGSSP